MKDFFVKLISRTDPTSSMRYVMVIGVLFTVIVVVTTWAVISQAQQKILDVPTGTALFFLGLLGILISGKVAQFWKEKIPMSGDLFKEDKDDDTKK